MARTLEELDREVTSLRAELDALRRNDGSLHPVERMIGCFTGDEEFRKINEEIEAMRRIPDPGFPEDRDDVAA